MHVSLSIFITLVLLEKAFFNDYYFCVPARARWTLSSRLTWIQSLMLKMHEATKDVSGNKRKEVNSSDSADTSGTKKKFKTGQMDW